MWTLWFLTCDGRPRLALDTSALAWRTTGDVLDLWSLYNDNGRDLPATTTALLAKGDLLEQTR